MPRFGIFSDTHANHEALTAVLQAYQTEKVDQFICLGDTVGYGASPNETCNRVREIATHTILGNHDAAVAGRMDYSFYYEAARQALDLHATLLTPENMNWLKSIPYQVHDKEADVLFCHGSPLHVEEFEYIFAPEQAARCLDIWDNLARITFIGHSHLCKAFAMTKHEVFEVVSRRFELRPGHKYIVSVGSVGQPRDYDNRASYTLYDSDSHIFEFKRAEYDIESAARKIFDTKLERNFGNRLFIGV